MVVTRRFFKKLMECWRIAAWGRRRSRSSTCGGIGATYPRIVAKICA